MRRLGLALVLALAAAACGQTHGCAQPNGGLNGGDSQPPAGLCPCEPGSAPVVDPKLMAFLSKARAAHHGADLAEQADDRQRAIQVLRAVVDGPRPPGTPPAPEVVEVLADTYARLADLRSAGGELDGSLRDVEEGLKLAASPSHFRGHLFEMRGVVWERRSKELATAGAAADAEKARQNAIQAFQQAIEIQDEVIARALGDGGP